MWSQISLIAAQDHISGKRYATLGYPKEKLNITGNIKYDLSITDELREKIDDLRSLWVKIVRFGLQPVRITEKMKSF